jgi:AmmeMemoRadiSam system protein B
MIGNGGTKLVKIMMSFLFVTISLSWPGAQAGRKEVEKLLDSVGIKPRDGMRGQMDIIGFPTSSEQMDEVLEQCRKLFPVEAASAAGAAPLVAAVCPHDDYYYAARLYSLVMRRLHAKRIVIFGVFHKARIFGCRDRLVFDTFEKWRGPYGPVTVSPLRNEIIDKLPRDDYIVDDDMQTVEHSVEAMIPFLQAYDRNVEIVSILVPYMDWERIEKLSGDLSEVLASIIEEHGWKLGLDLAFICSADAVHYGDVGWGGRNFAAFGTDVDGYVQAVERDEKLARETLCGELKGENLRNFLYTCVDSLDVTRYRLTWCGRFSIPFGLRTIARLVSAVEGRALTGSFLGYGTSISEPSLDTSRLGTLGPTAPNNLHHFVGYAAVGYR